MDVLSEIPRLAAWPEHRRVLTRAFEYLEQDSRVVGVLLGGSFVSGDPDFYSDLDLYLVINDDHFTDMLAEKEKTAAAVDRMITGFVPDHLGPGGDEMYIAVYGGPVKLDFNYLRRSATKPNWKMTRRVIPNALE